MWILLAFLVVPVIEIGLFVTVGDWIGLWPTLALVLLSAVAGTWLVRAEGARALADLRGALADLRDPRAPLAHGALILLAGALLVTPGFFTDICGLLLLLPGVRRAVLAFAGRHVRLARFEMGGAGQRGPGQRGPGQRGAPSPEAMAREGIAPEDILRPRGRPGFAGDRVIDGEFFELDPDAPAPSAAPPRRPSGWTRAPH